MDLYSILNYLNSKKKFYLQLNVFISIIKKITNLVISQKFESLIDSFPAQFYSETFNELSKDKDLYDILNSQDQEKINTFENKLAQINNYFEQFEAFRKFV